MHADVLTSHDEALNLVNTAMFRLQNALRAPIANITDSFPLKEGVNKANFEKELAKFPDMTLHMVLHEAATSAGPAHDFCSKAAIKYWVFDGMNPFELLFPIYKQEFESR